MDDSKEKAIMNKKIATRIFGISLLTVGVCAIITGVSGIFGLQLPDIAVRIIGVIDLVAVVPLAISFVRLYIIKKNKE